MRGHLLFLVLVQWSLASHQPDPGIFQFTQSVYNLSISEKWELNSPAWSSFPQRIGVFIPIGYDSIGFKIVQGDDISTFKLVSQNIGNFAFLTVSVQDGQILNRELQNEYDLIIKASAKNKREGNFEAQCLINIKVIDDNDILPFFRDPEYKVDVDTKIPANSRLVQLRAVDADSGLNGELLYSLKAPSDFFYIEPRSGWLRTFKNLMAGTYILTCSVEDRSSRLFFQTRSPSGSEVNVTISVREAPSSPPILNQKAFPLQYYTETSQKAALLEISDTDIQLDLSSDVLGRGDIILERLSSFQYLLYISRTSNKSPEPVSLILRDNKNKVFTAENISLVMDSDSRRVWFNGATEEETPRIKISIKDDIMENTIIYRFQANTSYSEDKNNIKYRIHGRESSKLPFLLEKNTGILRAKSILTVTDNKPLEFSVVAKLDNVDDRTEKAFLDVFVTIIPAKLKCPKFTNLPKSFQLALEDPQVGHVIFAPEVDIDDIIFKIQPISGGDNSKLENGKVILSRMTSTPFQIVIMAIHKCESVLLYTSVLLSVNFNATSKVEFKGHIHDTCSLVNNYSPVFDDMDVLRTVDTVDVGATVGFVYARDSDYGINGVIRYTTSDSFFNVNGTSGEITVIRPLEFLINGSSDVYKHEMLIQATDMAFENSKSSSRIVDITIDRSNLHSPIFEKPNYYIRIKEETLMDGEVLRLKAIDEDAGTSGRVEYRLAIETEYVSVDPDTGVFRLEHPLDREVQSSFTFPVVAIDRGKPPRFASCNVTIFVEDVNDNSPVCLRDIHEVKVYEDVPNGALIMCLAVTDLDDGDNAKLVYKLVEDVPFMVESESGCLFTKLKEPLDFEDVDTFKFNVAVLDQGQPHRSTECPVIIQIVDVNENLLPPIFTKTVYETSINENTMEVTKLVTVKATDPEEKRVIYRLAGGDGLGLFAVDRISGDIYAIEPLNAEIQQHYWLAIEAKDEARMPLSTVSFVVVKVNDVNDHIPLFSQPVYYGKVMENSEANKVVVRLNATDHDLTDNIVTYEMEKGNVQSNFLLDQNTGFLVTGRRHLDRETQSVHELYIQACDSSVKPLCTSVLVVITVIDENDNVPQFKQTAVALKIPANKIGYLARIFADDADEDGPNSLITYSLEGNTDLRFTIDEYGRFFTSEPILPNTVVNFTVSAEDNGEHRLRSDVSVTLTALGPKSLSNSSNHPPVFKSPEKWRHLYASDRDTVGTILGRVEVEDEDGDPCWYVITDTFWNPNSTFAFHGNNGELVLARRVNLIDVNLKTIELEIMVSDGWVEIHEKIHIHVTRSFHGRPIFDKDTTEVEFLDDIAVGYVIHQLNAHINFTNGGISHVQNIIYGIHFIDQILVEDSIKVDSATGSLLLEKPLARSIERTFSIVVTAKVNKGLESFAMIKFRRVPVNENPPKCVDDVFDFYCEGNEIGQVLAFDLDEGSNGKLEYYISNGHMNELSINQTTGVLIATQPVIHQTTLDIKVTDMGKSAKSTICKVNIAQRRPNATLTFKKDYSNLVVKTGKDIKEKALVLDIHHEEFISYGSEQCKFIEVGFGDGAVSQKNYLGPNEIDAKRCILYGQIYDQRVNSNVTVTVIDSERERSIITNVLGHIKRDASPGSYVFKDTNMKEKLKISNGDGLVKVLSPQERCFAVDQNGFVFVKDMKEITEDDFWNFLVGVQKSVSLSADLVNVNINIMAANHRAPIFKTGAIFELLVPAYKDTLIGVLQASDPDGDSVKYALRSSTGLSSQITVHLESGEMRLTNSLLSLKSKDEVVEVIASDGLHTTSQTIHIKILEDHQGLTCRAEYDITAPENFTSTKSKELASLDWPLNSEIGENFKFIILNDVTGAFDVDYRLGIFYLHGKTPLDREQRSEFDLIVLITSSNKPHRFCRSVIHIKVEDINDCVPHFLHLPYEIWLSEDVKEGERLLTVKAKDEDLGPYGTVRYSLSSSEALDFIEINKVDGKVKLKKKLSEAQAKVNNIYRFNVIAQDQGNPPLQSKEEVVIHIADRNQPIFSHTRYTTRISEASAPGTTIFNVYAKSNTNGTLAYVIMGGDPKKQFSIDFFSGRLMVNAELDREIISEYLLEIKAIDITRARINASAYVKINVDDVNDTPPIFTLQIFEFVALESASEGILLGTVNAVDPDITPPDNVVTYSIREGDKSVISIDSKSGMIYLCKTLDFETKSEFEWILTASDSDGFSSETLLRLHVKDENDNSPKFISAGPLTIVLGSGSLTNQFIHQVRINDSDTVLSPPLSSHVFKITSGDETMFSLNTEDGILWRIRSFDAEEIGKAKDGRELAYNITISVFDGLFTSYLPVIVIFKPSNEQLRRLEFDSLMSRLIINNNRVIPNKTVVKTMMSVGGMAPKIYTPITSFPLLTVNSQTGNVYLSKRVPRSTMPIVVPFMVRDMYNNIAVKKVEARIESDNIHSPVFIVPSDGYHVHISSASMIGERFAKILASDDDFEDVLEYSLNSKTTFISLDPKTGYLAVKGAIPPGQTGINVGVTVSDRNNPPHISSTILKVQVVVGPVPQFSRFHYHLTISEDAKQGKLIGELMVSQGENVIYDIPTMPENKKVPFIVEEDSGKITLSEEIDRESEEKYEFVVRVRDQNKRTAFTYVTINVLDVNDNAPVFETSLKELKIREDVEEGQTIFIFNAVDLDSEDNARISYEVNENGHFRIDKDDGYLVLKSRLDRETKDRHELVISAKDNGGLSSTLYFTIHVLDVNDNAPQFDQLMYKATIPIIGLKMGQKIIDFKLSDADSDEVQTVTVTLSTNPWSGILYVNGSNVILGQLPTEEIKILGKLIAFDGIYSSQAAIEVMFVGESNANECDEKEDRITLTSIKTNELIKNLDFDKRALSNHLIGAERSPFHIINGSKLILKGDAAPGNYLLHIRSKIRVQSQKSRYCLTSLAIELLNYNKFAPQFLVQEYQVYYNENQKASEDKMELVFRLEAKDSDRGVFGDIKYNIVGNESSLEVVNYFYIDEFSGCIMAKAPIDREKHSNFTLKIAAVDGGGLKDYATLHIIVNDANDNEPQFERAVYDLKILENEAVGYEVLKLVAQDPDNNTQLSFYLADKEARNYLTLDGKTGVLRLSKSLDYEEVQQLKFDVGVSDGEHNSTALVSIEVLDVNDNSPRFSTSIYEVRLKEDAKAGSDVIQVTATDPDSEHFGKISYSISGDDSEHFTISDSGIIRTTSSLDFEKQKLYRLNVKAIDGGTPALSDDCLVTVVIEDVNDNPPVFDICNLTAVIQEGIEAGQALLRLTITDNDSDKFGAPFRLEVTGEGASAFTFDPLLNLITTRQLSYSEQNIYNLTVTAYDSGDLSASCPLKVYVKQQSRHPPNVQPQTIMVNILMGEFTAQRLGRVYASDKDPEEMLRYAVVRSEFKKKATELVVDPISGTLTAVDSLLPGLHRFNVSVTDGKYTVYAPITVDVTNIHQEALENSVSVKMGGVNARDYINRYMTRVHDVLVKVFGVKMTNIRILAMQDVINNRKGRRETVIAAPSSNQDEVELLLTVLRESGGFYRPIYVKQKITEGIAQITAELGLEVTSLTSEICRRDTCSKGECRDRVWLDNVDINSFEDTQTGNSYSFPRFQRTFECICRQGFAGHHCDVAINQCSRDDVCNKAEVCVPMEDESTGLQCICPPGTQGVHCRENTCPNAAECSQKTSLSMLGSGFFQMSISQSIEQRMDISIEFKAAGRNAVVMHGAGLSDFHILRIINGHLEYEWDCGSGPGRVRIDQKLVDDGQWHTVRVVRRRRHAQMVLDETYTAADASQGLNDVLNLYSDAMILRFGANVTDLSLKKPFESSTTPPSYHSASEIGQTIENGLVGCIGKIGLDGFDLPKNPQGMRMHNTKVGCDAQIMGPCLNAPCLNQGQCIPKKGSNSHSCICPQRYTGAKCEIDLNACASNPCPKGIKCHNLYNDFHCSCPPGFTGKTCQMHGDWDPCVTNPCGPFGACQRDKSTFICSCSDGFGGSFCSERVPHLLTDSLLPGSPQFYVFVSGVLLALLLAIVIVIMFRRQNQNLNKKSQESDPLPFEDASDPLIATPIPSVCRNPPGLSTEKPPPRPPRQRNHHFNLPTVEVRPMQSIDRSNLDTPPQPPKHRNLYDTASDLDMKPQPPPHQSLTKTEKKAADAEMNHSEGSDYLTMMPVKRSPPTSPHHHKATDLVNLYDNPIDAPEG